MGLDPRYAQDAESLKQVQVVTADGKRVPLSAFARFKVGNAPLSVRHQGLFASDSVSFSLAPGVSLEQATQAIEHRSEEHTSELQSLMRISYAVFCLNKKKR